MGTDAVHTDPDYSAAYVILKTDATLEGHGLTFTIGRGNEVCAAAIEAFRHLVVGRDSEGHHRRFRRVLAQPGRRIATAMARSRKGRHPSRARGRSSMRCGICMRRSERKPVWKLLADMTPARAGVVHRLPSHHRRAHARRGALDSRASGIDEGGSARPNCCETAIPPTPRRSAGLDTPTKRFTRLCREALEDGWTHFKVKVGGKPEDDLRRLTAVRAAIGPDRKLMIDSNQRWDVDEAIARIRELSHVRPLVGRGADAPGRRARACRASPRRSRPSASRRASTPPTA